MDPRIFKLTAECSQIKHLEYEIDYSDATAKFYICTSKLDVYEFNDRLWDLITKANKWEICFKSFERCCSPVFEKFYIEYYLRMTANRFARKRLSYKTKVKKTVEKEVSFKGLEKLNQEITEVIEAGKLARRWIETPPNILTPEKYVSEIIDETKKLGITCQVFDWKELKRRGFNLITAVGNNLKRSYLVTLTHGRIKEDEGNDQTESIAFIGKGVCFDTGGVSLKPSRYMMGMKRDMAGSAIVIALYLAMVKLNITGRRRAAAVAVISENLIGSRSVVVDSVVESYGGETVEINNSDAEGRLLMKEAIEWSSNDLKCRNLVTIATLTGAIEQALGTRYTGAWFDDEDENNWVNNKIRKIGAHIWRMPWGPWYLIRNDDCLGDWKNSEKEVKGGSCQAAQFLRESVPDLREFKLLHFDLGNVESSMKIEEIIGLWID